MSTHWDYRCCCAVGSVANFTSSDKCSSESHDLMVNKWQSHRSKLPRFSFFSGATAKKQQSCRQAASRLKETNVWFDFSAVSVLKASTWLSDVSIQTKMGFPPSAGNHCRQWVILWTGTRKPPSPGPQEPFANLSNHISSWANNKASYSSTNLRISPKHTLLAVGQMEYGLLAPPHTYVHQSESFYSSPTETAASILFALSNAKFLQFPQLR